MTDRLRIGACLSLTGRFAQFGRQAALGLEAWRSLDGTADVIVEDDRSDRRTLEAVLPGVAARCDILLGPYSTILMRAAGRIAADSGRLIWNHGGSGDDVEQAHPGHVVSVLTPTSRYAEPFLRYIASGDQGPRDLYVVQGPGSFGRQVAEGAAMMARQFGVRAVRAEPGEFPPARLPRGVGPVQRGRLRAGRGAGRQIAAVARTSAPGVHGGRRRPRVRPGGRRPRRACSASLSGSRAAGMRSCSVQARRSSCAPTRQAAAACRTIRLHRQRPGPSSPRTARGMAGSTNRDDLWAAAAGLETSTLFGGFKIDPQTGAQVSHRTVLVRWTEDSLAL